MLNNIAFCLNTFFNRCWKFPRYWSIWIGMWKEDTMWLMFKTTYSENPSIAKVTLIDLGRGGHPQPRWRHPTHGSLWWLWSYTYSNSRAIAIVAFLLYKAKRIVMIIVTILILEMQLRDGRRVVCDIQVLRFVYVHPIPKAANTIHGLSSWLTQWKVFYNRHSKILSCNNKVKIITATLKKKLFHEEATGVKDVSHWTSKVYNFQRFWTSATMC